MEPTEQNRRAWDEAHRAQSGQRHGGLPSPVRHALADLHGKRVLNVASGTGEAAAELAELGATVTAVDPEADALSAARRRWPSILWVEGPASGLPRELRRGRFDLVYAGEGTLARVADVTAWADAIATALAPGGDLLLYDEHPVARSVDGLMHWRDSYFTTGLRLGQIVTALAHAGLSVRALEEYPQAHGNVRRHAARIPGTFLLHARRS
jgi:ubiquinone/menaquinone biosynthesis C-methylase UbiE